MSFRRLIAVSLAFCIAGLGIQQSALAAAISTEAAVAVTAQPAERERILRFLDRADVQQQLQARGVSAADAKARVAALSDADLEQLAGGIDSLPAAGMGIIGAVVLVFLVLLLTDILGFTKIFPFTKPMK